MSAPHPEFNPRRTARATEVVLGVDDDGNVTVDPYYAIFEYGQPLVWVTTEEDSLWAVSFHGKRSPTEKFVLRGQARRVIEPPSASRLGHFSYSVAVYRQRHPRADGPAVFLDANCPEIIIDYAGSSTILTE